MMNAMAWRYWFRQMRGLHDKHTYLAGILARQLQEGGER